MTDQYDEKTSSDPTGAPEVETRRTFLRGLGKWSQAAIGGVLLGGALVESERAKAWVAGRGYGGSAAVGARGGWVNRYGGGGGWANRAGGGGWINGGGYRYGGGGWINGGGGGGGWINRYGGGGSAWVNRY
ncbi:MAG TPA: hypothetical protein PK018_12445 [Candidatus Competibacter sp.]|nr:hypothetical protein [Candidatus Competibacteraceae bacterium]HPE72957.1 hypothetical protein [Candidatus Competibacter sp.]HRW67039.1 hypothetical protein [Candidatus Competibacter sp.]